MGRRSLGARTYAVCFSLAVLTVARAQQLPVRNYTAADGLPHNSVNCIVKDSHGFLWFCTSGGLSRFDGYRFTNYGVSDGLPSGEVDAFYESREGDYWVGTAGGLCRFDPMAGRRSHFTCFRPEETRSRRVLSILKDHAGNLWCGTRMGLYLFRLSQNGAGSFELIDLGFPEGLPASALAEDRYGSLWIGTEFGLFRRNPDGRIDRYWAGKTGRQHVNSLLIDRRGTLWAGTWDSLWKISLPPRSGPEFAQRALGSEPGLVGPLLQSQDGHIWAGTEVRNARGGGRTVRIELCELEEGGARVLHRYSKNNGIELAVAVGQDREGELWLGTDGFGAVRIARNGFSTFETDKQPTDILETQAGEICMGQRLQVSMLNEGGFVSIAPLFPMPITNPGWSYYHTILQDHGGDWWFPTGQGLFRFGPAASARSLAAMTPKAVYTERDGLASDEVFRLFEDRAGNIWVASIGPPGGHTGLSCWERATGKWRHYFRDLRQADILRTTVASSFGQDRSESLWIGFWVGQLARFRDGLFQFFTESDGWIGGEVRVIHEDRFGTVWIASSRGLTYVLDPRAAHPQFRHFSFADGLSSDEVMSVISDDAGRIYAGTGDGVDQIEVTRTSSSIQIGRIRHYTSAEGLARGRLGPAYRDRHGDLWFAADEGVSRLRPSSPVSHSAPAQIRALHIAGVPLPISDLGETAVSLPTLKPSQNNVVIEYSSLNFVPGETPRYQYILEGADHRWGEPTTERSVSYANLSPGSYRFLVRVADPTEAGRAVPSSIIFTIDPPLWRRWWFLAALGIALIAAASAFYRLRVDRLLELERVRTRIATDLHDDIGANLSRIAILSEVASRKDADSHNHEELARIAEVSRETVHSMSDIVWAVDPEHDRLVDLTNRMRGFASDVFEGRNIKLRFHATAEQDVRVAADVRREIFLIFKESINNAARHSGCDAVEIEVRVENSSLHLMLADNGKGLEGCAASCGHGLNNIRRRAAALGGEIEVTSRGGGGVSVHLRVPLSHRMLHG